MRSRRRWTGAAHGSRRRYAEASASVRQGLAIVAGLPGFDRQRGELAEALDLATSAGRIAELHALAETIRFRYGLSPPPAEEAPRSSARSHRPGRRGIRYCGASRPEPSAETKSGVRTDLRDLVVLWADLRVRYAAADERDGRAEEAVGILAEAEA